MNNRLGVCSWSLLPESPADLAARVRACGLRRVQLALDLIRDGFWGLAPTRRAFSNAGIEIISAMMATRGEDYTTIDSIRATGGLRPDQHWHANLEAARDHAAIVRELGVTLVTFHAGFIPEEPGDPLRRIMIERIGAVAAVFEEAGVGIALETGQESPETLLDVLADPLLANVGINFDPANMILYGAGDPIAALELLAPRVAQMHLKDALPAATPGTWGTETPLGEGNVDWDAFFRIVGARLPDTPLLIERESGHQRVADVQRAAEVAASFGAKR